MTLSAAQLATVQLVICFSLVYGLGRTSLILPLTAIDEPGGLSRAWRLTRRNGWRLVVGILIAYLAMVGAIGLAMYTGDFSYEAASRPGALAWRTRVLLATIQAFYFLGAALEAAFSASPIAHSRPGR